MSERTVYGWLRRYREGGIEALRPGIRKNRGKPRSPGAHPKMLAALDFLLDRPREVFVIIPEAGGDPEPLLARLRRTYLPNRIVTTASAGREVEALARHVPALEGKRSIGGRVTAFVCEGGRCELPTSDPEVFARQLAQVVALPGIGAAAR